MLLTQLPKSTIPKLPDALAGDAHHAADLLERPRLAVIQPKVESEHLGVARRERREGEIEVGGPAVGHGRSVCALLREGHEALHATPLVRFPDWMVEPHRLDMKGAERADGVTGQTGGGHELLGGRHATQLLREERGGPAQTIEIRGAVQWHPHRPAVPGDRRLYGLANPPHGVRNELD